MDKILFKKTCKPRETCLDDLVDGVVSINRDLLPLKRAYVAGIKSSSGVAGVVGGTSTPSARICFETGLNEPYKDFELIGPETDSSKRCCERKLVRSMPEFSVDNDFFTLFVWGRELPERLGELLVNNFDSAVYARSLDSTIIIDHYSFTNGFSKFRTINYSC